VLRQPFSSGEAYGRRQRRRHSYASALQRHGALRRMQRFRYIKLPRAVEHKAADQRRCRARGRLGWNRLEADCREGARTSRLRSPRPTRVRCAAPPGEAPVPNPSSGTEASASWHVCTPPRPSLSVTSRRIAKPGLTHRDSSGVHPIDSLACGRAAPLAG